MSSPAGQGGGGILEFRLQHHGAAEILSREEGPLAVLAVLFGGAGICSGSRSPP